MRDALHMARTAPMLPPHAARPLIAQVFEGLSEDPKQLPSTLYFDTIGSVVYDALCAQAEHYPARAEDGLLRRHAADIATLSGSRPALVDYGSGDGRQARILLQAMPDPLAYVPLDVEATQLRYARERMRTFRAHLPVHSLCQDLREYVVLPLAATRAARKLGLLGGMPFDSFRPLEAVAVLNSIRETLGPHGSLVIGVDLCKEPAVMLRAYDDAGGRAGALNRNVLERLNRELDATFSPDAFRHVARWNEAQQRVEVALVSRATQVPRVAGIGVALAADEEIVTLHSYKYTPEGFGTLARIAGWEVHETWTDTVQNYRLYYLTGSQG
jgi:L-histidine Nalpha-methyltransferase